MATTPQHEDRSIDSCRAAARNKHLKCSFSSELMIVPVEYLLAFSRFQGTDDVAWHVGDAICSQIPPDPMRLRADSAIPQ